VYVAGPISRDVFNGVWKGFEAGRQLFLDGLAPFVPHFDALFFLPDGNWNAYLEYDLEYILTTEAVYRLRGESRGADLEVKHAMENGIPVFYEASFEGLGLGHGGYRELLQYADRQGLRGQRMAVNGPVEVPLAEATTIHP
jgi:hypothetical protein